MKDLVNDTLWFRGPDGGEMTISLGGYPPKEITRLIRSLSNNGWELVKKEKVVQEKWELPKWVIPYCVGFIVGIFTPHVLAFLIR